MSEKDKNITLNATATTAPAKKSIIREWLDAILFAVVVATIVRWLVMELFMIPTPSMEKSYLVGDYLFVSKFHYGARTPKTPLQVPLTHQYIWGTQIPSYTDVIQLPQFRLPGISEVKRGDVVVFNYPLDKFPTDLKTNYVKRCVGVAGDTIEVRDTQVFIDSKPAENPAEMAYQYLVKTNGEVINDIKFKDLKMRTTGAFPDAKHKGVPQIAPDGRQYNAVPEGYDYVLNLTNDNLKAIKELSIIKDIKVDTRTKGEPEAGIFTENSAQNSNRDFFGKLYIPKKGATMTMNAQNVATYFSTIRNYEGLKAGNVTTKEGKLLIDGKLVEKYTFVQDYYFMMGDNRHDSADSRYWGFVPADHVVGKAAFVFFSVDSESDWFSGKLRFERFYMVWLIILVPVFLLYLIVYKLFKRKDVSETTVVATDAQINTKK